jgi:hypothetical protein
MYCKRPTGWFAPQVHRNQLPRKQTVMPHWRKTTPRADAMHGPHIGEAGYAMSWTISGLVTLGAILTVWVLAI